MTTKRFDWSVAATLVVAIVSALISVAVAYSHETDTSHQRITVVETHQSDMDKRLDRMEDTLNRILEVVTRK